MVELKRKAKERPPVISCIPVAVLYSDGSKKKLDDLMSLLQFVPPVYHDFYKNLQATDVESEAEED